MLHHGGGLNSAAKCYGIPVDKWLDLSTGINPHTWPVPDIPLAIYNRLPEADDNLHECAKKYYQAQSLLAIPGSQSVIQLLPQLRKQCRVAVPVLGYAEHAHAWREAGHHVDCLNTDQIETNLNLYDVVVVINPNNPSGELIEPKILLGWHKKLQKKSGWLIVDEAFMDTRQENSLSAYAHVDGLLVLRSMGKFFGLAGIRSGFVLAEKKLLDVIENKLGPWTVTGPSRYMSALALQDFQWHKSNIKFLQQQSQQLKKLLTKCFEVDQQKSYIKGTDLFQTLFCDNAGFIHNALAKEAVLTRLLDNQQGIRFGLPMTENMPKLESVLGNIKLK